jgi:hypothetical protein
MNFPALRLPAMTFSLLLAGCGTSIYSVRIPLMETPVAVAGAANVVIRDARPDAERSTHTGRNPFRCERWYGDANFEPSRLATLQQLIAERIPADTGVELRLDRFDAIEYCENTANRAGAAAVAGASGAMGTPIYLPAGTVPGGDSVHLRLAGEVNGAAFDVFRAFDYDGLPYKFGDMPSSNARYRELLWTSMRQIADEIVAKIPTGATP